MTTNPIDIENAIQQTEALIDALRTSYAPSEGINEGIRQLQARLTELQQELEEVTANATVR